MKLGDISIKRKIIAFALIISIIPVAMIGVYAYNETRSAIHGEIQTKLEEQVILEYDFIKTTFTLAQEKVNSDLGIARHEFYDRGRPSIVEGNMVMGDDYVVNDNFEIVDDINAMVGGTATVFQVINNEAVRISTNVIKEDGNRAVGTTVSKPVYEAVIKRGETFYGRAWVVNAWYLTAYEPIKDSSGKIIGILYVGILEAPYIAQIKEQMESIVVGETGYLYVMDSEGTLIIHSTLEGENLHQYAFVKEICANKEGFIRYPWDGKDKVVAYSYYEPRDWIIASGSYLADFSGPIYAIRNGLIVAILIFSIIGSIVGLWFSRLITKPVDEMLQAANSIADGDLDVNLTNTSGDEIGQLSQAVRKMADTLSGVIDDVNMLAEAGTDGKLDVRADTSKHSGDFGKLVQGVNDTLDGVNRPLKVVIEYIDRISRGDMPERSTGDARGVFIEVQRTMNQCIDAINAMIEDTNMLAQAGVDGRLDARADATKHDGDFRKIIQGVNDLIDAVGVPVNEVARIVNAYAEGELDARGQIEVQGEFKALGETLDQFGDDLQAVVAEAGRIAGKAADGDLTVKAEIELKGEYNDLVNSVDSLVGVLSDAITDSRNVGERVLATAQGLSSAAEEMNAGMEQLASSSQQVAEGSQKLAELSQTTARDVEEVASQIEQTSTNASKSSEMGQGAVDATHEVQEAAQKTLDGLAQIQEGVARTSETVGDMNTAIERVGEMGDVITDVAGQTNMLGLNAAIEAARAGEAGRGFAVVADAVKNLAEKVKEAAGESGMAIGNIQESGENAIGATGTAVDEATKGGELMHTALDGINDVVGSIEGVNSMVQEIDSGTKTVSKVVQSVVAGMDEVASISEESASAAEESSAAVQQQTSAIEELTSETQTLTDVAQSMMDELGKFTVRE